jgi:glycosyltransferase involved in cell wall biosynthesis
MTAVIVPTHNEEKNIRPFLAQIPQGYHPIIIDDSSDATADLAEEMGAIVLRMPRAKWQYIPLKYMLGLQTAKRLGYEIGITMDCGDNFMPYEVELLDKDADLVIGQRRFYGKGIRRIISNVASLAVSLLGVDLDDATCGFRAYKLDKLPDSGIISKSPHAFQIEMLVKWEGTIDTVDIPYRPPEKSTLSLWTFYDWARVYASLYQLSRCRLEG